MNQQHEEKKFLVETLLLAATGSVGVLIVPHYINLLRQSFVKDVHVLMSRSAQKFVTPYTMRLFSGHWVFTNTFSMNSDIRVPHIELASKADLMVIMPATANIISKAACGSCDDLISTTITACKAPVVFVPSMNQEMWSNRAVQRNIYILKGLGYHVIPPTHGYAIADMKPSFGAIPDFETIVKYLTEIVANSSSESAL